MANYMPNINEALRMALNALHHEPESIDNIDLQDVANRLSFIAKKTPPWGWKYLRNILSGKLEGSPKLYSAIMRLGAVIDDTPFDIARSVPVEVMAIGIVKPGSLIFSDSRICANPGCNISFIPRVPNQICHSLECTKIYKKTKSNKIFLHF